VLCHAAMPCYAVQLCRAALPCFFMLLCRATMSYAVLLWRGMMCMPCYAVLRRAVLRRVDLPGYAVLLAVLLAVLIIRAAVP
jgi:hypothetical protein